MTLSLTEILNIEAFNILYYLHAAGIADAFCAFHKNDTPPKLAMSRRSALQCLSQQIACIWAQAGICGEFTFLKIIDLEIDGAFRTK